MPVVNRWARGFLERAHFSGSYAKGTAVKGGSDVDLFLSVEPGCPDTLRQIYETLHEAVRASGLPVRRQNVSIGTDVGAVRVDLVPGKRHSGNTNDHSLYLSKRGTWTKTNVVQHAGIIADSNRLDEIRLLKIWRHQHQLEFPSFYLELTVLEALRQRRLGALASNVLECFNYIANQLERARVEDPANTNNIISEDLTASEKRTVAVAARAAIDAASWSEVVK